MDERWNQRPPPQETGGFDIKTRILETIKSHGFFQGIFKQAQELAIQEFAHRNVLQYKQQPHESGGIAVWLRPLPQGQIQTGDRQVKDTQPRSVDMMDTSNE